MKSFVKNGSQNYQFSKIFLPLKNTLRDCGFFKNGKIPIIYRKYAKWDFLTEKLTSTQNYSKTRKSRFLRLETRVSRKLYSNSTYLPTRDNPGAHNTWKLRILFFFRRKGRALSREGEGFIKSKMLEKCHSGPCFSSKEGFIKGRALIRGGFNKTAL